MHEVKLFEPVSCEQTPQALRRIEVCVVAGAEVRNAAPHAFDPPVKARTQKLHANIRRPHEEEAIVR
jgi:hypothetical protein